MSEWLRLEVLAMARNWRAVVREKCPTRARLHTAKEIGKERKDKVVVCRPGRSPSRDPQHVDESHLFSNSIIGRNPQKCNWKCGLCW
jgi:hypothetical protein